MEADILARKVYDKMMENDHCSRSLGMELVEVREGYCKLSMKVTRNMLNGFGILHGGIAFTFADSAFAFASNSYGRAAVSTNGSMNYAKSAVEGDLLLAEAKMLNLSYRTADFDVDVTNENGEVYYRFRGTVYRSSKEILKQN